MTYLAACGTVNRADNSVNVRILGQYEQLLQEPGLIQLKTFLGATPDIYYFVLAIRLAHRLETVDDEHDKTFATGDTLTAGFFSRFKNFSVTRPAFDENELKKVITILSKPMTNASNNKTLITLLTGFRLPTAGYFLKRYSLGSRLDNNEHVSWVVKPTDDDPPDDLDKGYEHKVCFFVPFAQTTPATNVDLLETAFTTNITSIFTSNPALSYVLSIANIPRSIDNRSPTEKDKKLPILAKASVFLGGSAQFTPTSIRTHLHDEITYGSPTWNKLVITVKQGELSFSTVVQWKINLRDGLTGKEAELVFNAWNLVASRPGMGNRLSQTGQENYLATTKDINSFAKMLGATHTTGCDLTCTVPGGKIVSGWPALNAATWTDYTSKQQSNLLFLHPPTIPGIVGCPVVGAGEKEFHPPCDLRKNTYNLVTEAAIIFDTITALEPSEIEQWKSSFKRGLEIFSPKNRVTRHSVNNRDEFYAVLQLFDALSKSDSIESNQLVIHPKIEAELQQVCANQATASNLLAIGITNVDLLVQGIYRYLRYVTNHLYGAYKTYTEGNLALASGNVDLALDDTALTRFFKIIHALKLSFFSFQFKSVVLRVTRSDIQAFEALKTKIYEEAKKNAAEAKAAKKRVRTTAVPDEDDLNQDDKISEYSEQLYALPYLPSDKIEAFLNRIRWLFKLSTNDKQANLVNTELLDVISNIIIPGLNTLLTNPTTEPDEVTSVNGGTRRRRYSKRRRTNRNNSPRRRSRYNYNNKNKKNNKNNKKKPNRTRRRT
jgi:hypothetical protein